MQSGSSSGRVRSRAAQRSTTWSGRFHAGPREGVHTGGARAQAGTRSFAPHVDRGSHSARRQAFSIRYLSAFGTALGKVHVVFTARFRTGTLYKSREHRSNTSGLSRRWWQTAGPGGCSAASAVVKVRWPRPSFDCSRLGCNILASSLAP